MKLCRKYASSAQSCPNTQHKFFKSSVNPASHRQRNNTVFQNISLTREPRGRSSSSKRGRGAAEEDVEEDKSVGEPGLLELLFCIILVNKS